MARIVPLVLSFLAAGCLAPFAQGSPLPANPFMASPSTGLGYLSPRSIGAADLPRGSSASVNIGSQLANLFAMSPNGSPGVMLVRAPVAADFPTGLLSQGGCTVATAAGFTGDGVSDNLAAWNAWVTSVGTANACLTFPAGVFSFSAAASFSLASAQNVSIQGAAPEATELTFPNSGNGFVFTYTQANPAYINSSSLSFSDATISTSQLGLGDGLKITGNNANGAVPKSTFIKDVAFRGHLTGKYWTNNLNFQNLYQVMLKDVSIYGPDGIFTEGTGVLFNGPSRTAQSIVLNIWDMNAYFLNKGVAATGAYQGVNITHSNFTGVGTGIQCGDGTANGSQCIVTNSQIAPVHNAITLNVPGGAWIANNLFILGAYAGALTTDYAVKMTNADGTVINGNIFDVTNAGSGSYPSCIDLSNGDGSPGITITGNIYYHCTTTYKFSTGSLAEAIVGNTYQAGAPVFSGFQNGGQNLVLDAANPTSAVFSSFGAQLFRNIGAAPTISACGTSPSITATSTSAFGQFTTGARGPTACTLTFANPQWQAAAACVVQSISGFAPLAEALVTIGSPSTVAIAFSAAASSVPFTYVCNGN